MQRVWLANRGHLLLQTPGPVAYGTCICSNVETIHSWTCHVYEPFEFRTSLGTSILLIFLLSQNRFPIVIVSSHWLQTKTFIGAFHPYLRDTAYSQYIRTWANCFDMDLVLPLTVCSSTSASWAGLSGGGAGLVGKGAGLTASTYVPELTVLIWI